MNQLPPQNLELEEIILSSLMTGFVNFDELYNDLQPEDFYSTSNRLIYLSILTLYKSGKQIDLLTVQAELLESGQLQGIGGLSKLAEICSRPASPSVSTYIRIIQELAIKRHLIAISANILDKGYKDTTDAFELLKTAENGIFEVTIKKNGKREKKIGDLYYDMVKGFELNQKGEFEGYKTGFSELDRLTLGIEDSNLVILAARPGMGKSALALNIASNLAQYIPVAFFSLEMSNRELTQRFGSATSGVPLQFIKTNSVFGKMYEKAFNNIQKANECKLYIDDTGGLSLLDMKSRLKRMILNYGIKFVFVDYLQKLKPENSKGRSRENEINEIASGLKDIAKEFKIPVVALAQLSRGVEQRADKRPMLSDLRESGAIEQEADKVLFIYREKYYNDSAGEESEIIVAKNRQGGLGSVKLRYNSELTKFENLNEYVTLGTDIDLKDLF